MQLCSPIALLSGLEYSLGEVRVSCGAATETHGKETHYKSLPDLSDIFGAEPAFHYCNHIYIPS